MHGAGILLERSTDIVPTIRGLVEDPSRYRALRAATATLATPDATETIIREIAALMPREKALASAEAAAA
jgi:UDP-N-acetylglucosamine:LPS N-acetylglucosamine transferase